MRNAWRIDVGAIFLHPIQPYRYVSWCRPVSLAIKPCATNAYLAEVDHDGGELDTILLLGKGLAAINLRGSARFGAAVDCFISVISVLRRTNLVMVFALSALFLRENFIGQKVLAIFGVLVGIALIILD